MPLYCALDISEGHNKIEKVMGQSTENVAIQIAVRSNSDET